jgi:hypothetical protein
VSTEELKESAPATEEPSVDEGIFSGAWPDESAESAFLAEARDRGETATPAKVRSETADEVDTKALPALNDLVQRIPANVRETLDELFRARFVSVKRVPKKALKI